jgi:hypothetical protein
MYCCWQQQLCLKPLEITSSKMAALKLSRWHLPTSIRISSPGLGAFKAFLITLENITVTGNKMEHITLSYQL